jgi:hypothetical protein
MTLPFIFTDRWNRANPLARHFPTSTDGLAGALFIAAVIRSNDMAAG